MLLIIELLTARCRLTRRGVGVKS